MGSLTPHWGRGRPTLARPDPSFRKARARRLPRANHDRNWRYRVSGTDGWARPGKAYIETSTSYLYYPETMALKVLVVDDKAAARDGLAKLLAGWGYEVDQAADGQEGLERAGATLPSVVVSDLVMPNLDGLGLLKALRRDLP